MQLATVVQPDHAVYAHCVSAAVVHDAALVQVPYCGVPAVHFTAVTTEYGELVDCGKAEQEVWEVAVDQDVYLQLLAADVVQVSPAATLAQVPGVTVGPVHLVAVVTV